MRYLLTIGGLVNDSIRDRPNPSNEYQTSWNLRGASQDVTLLYMIVAKRSPSRDFPYWNPGNELKATRDASMAITR